LALPYCLYIASQGGVACLLNALMRLINPNKLSLRKGKEKKEIVLTLVHPSFPKHQPIFTRECKRPRNQCIQRAAIGTVASKSQTWTLLN
jgi:hypothetical protein